MNKLLLLAVVLAAAPARAQIFVEGVDLPEGLKGSVKDWKEAHGPAKIDDKPVQELFDRLAKPFAPEALEGNVKGERVGVKLVEASCGQAQQGKVIDLVYRRCFSNILARGEKWTDLPKGEMQVEIWNFDIGLDGTIQAARRQTMVGKIKIIREGVGELDADPKRSKIEDLRPKDPAASKKWNELSPKLNALRPTQTV